MDLDVYGGMPNKEVADLKKQLAQQQAQSVHPEHLMSSMEKLTTSMSSMLELFKTAADEMKLEEKEETSLKEQLGPLMEKLDEIIEQNKIIAEGMVALSDLIKQNAQPQPQAPVPSQPSKFPGPPAASGQMPPSMQQSPFDEKAQAPPSMGPPPMGPPQQGFSGPSDFGSIPPPPAPEKKKWRR